MRIILYEHINPWDGLLYTSLQIVITVSIGILLFAHKKIGLVLIFAFAALGFIVSMVTYAVTAQLGAVSYTHLDVYKRQNLI